MEEILFKGKRADNGEWIEGHYGKLYGEEIRHYICPTPTVKFEIPRTIFVIPETVGQYIGETDKHGNKIFKGDITRLVLPNGEVRHFVVDFKTVVRTVKNHPDFEDGYSKVAITGVVFIWNGYELLPCVDINGVSDIKRMEVVGNIHDNPERQADKR